MTRNQVRLLRALNFSLLDKLTGKKDEAYYKDIFNQAVGISIPSKYAYRIEYYGKFEPKIIDKYLDTIYMIMREAEPSARKKKATRVRFKFGIPIDREPPLKPCPYGMAIEFEDDKKFLFGVVADHVNRKIEICDE